MRLRATLTGCGCALVVGLIGALLYVLIRGSSDEGEPVDALLWRESGSPARTTSGPRH